MAKRIDDTNKAIIRLLRDGRKPYSLIADELGITENTVRSRANKLLEDGVLYIAGRVYPEKIPGVQVLYMGIMR